MLSAYMGRAFLNILSLSLSGALVGTLILLIHPLTGKFFSQKWNYYIWFLVILRLLVPIQADAALPGGIAFDLSPLWAEEADAETAEVVHESGIADSAGEVSGSSMTDSAEEALGNDMTSGAEEALGSDMISRAEEIPENGMNDKTDAISENKSESMADNRWEGLFLGAAIIWSAGFLIILCMKLWHYFRFLLLLRKDIRPIEDGQITVMMQSLAARLHMRKIPPVYVSASVSGPVTVGLWRPFIVLPEAANSLTGYQLILHHEFVHVARRDLWSKWLYQMLLCVHWFNPILYLVDRKMNMDCELSCDEAILSMLTKEGRKTYGNVLLDIAEGNVVTMKSVFSTTFVTGSSELKRRLQNVLTFQKPTVIKILLSICVMAGTVFLTACGSVHLSYDSLWEDWEDDDVRKSYSSEADSDKDSGYEWNLLGAGKSDKDTDAWNCYDDAELLAGEDISDKWQAYSYKGGGNEVSISRFALNGSSSLRIVYAAKDTDIEITSEFDLKEGKFKIVHVAPDGSIAVLNDTGEKASQTVTLQTGRNVIKMVGQDAMLKNAEISFSGLKERYFESIYYSEEDEYAGQIADKIQDGTIEKEKVMESIYYMEQEDISEAFSALLKKGTVFDDEELSDIFIYSDTGRSGDYLLEAIDSGLMEPLSVDTLSGLMPFLEDKTAVGLINALPDEEFFEGLTRCMPYLGEAELEECLLAYVEAGEGYPMNNLMTLKCSWIRARSKNWMKKCLEINLIPFENADNLYRSSSSRPR